MNCENNKCNKEHDGTYGSGRFCCSYCARSFSSLEKREEINKKVSLKLKGVPTGRGSFTKEQQIKGGISSAKKKRDRLLEVPFESLKNISRRKRILIEQGNVCNTCKIKDWFGLPVTFEYHHKDGNKENNSRENVEMICPNCHSQTDNFRFKGKTHKDICGALRAVRH